MSGALVRALLPMRDAIDAVRAALAEHGRGVVRQPVRESLRTDGGVLALMPAELRASGRLGFKAVTVFPGNPDHGQPVHQAFVAVHDAATGRVRAIVDGTTITTIRTAAVSAVATDVLARPDATRLAILGSGVQAWSHLEALPLVRPIDTVAIWSRDAARARSLAVRAREELGLDARAVGAAEAAVRGAGIVTTVTSARTPILERGWLAAGVHVNAVGSCFPDTREIDAETVGAAGVWVDDLAAAAVEAGDLRLAVADGAFAFERIRGTIGEVLAGRVAGRGPTDDVTLFESLGLGLEDVAVACVVEARARDAGLGQIVEL